MILLLLLVSYVESSFFEIEENKDLEVILADIEKLRYAPLDINTASFEELAMIPYFSLNTCLKIVQYREQSGSYRSLDDLLNVSGIDMFVLEKIRPFITVRTKPFKLRKFAARARVKTVIPKQRLSEKLYTKAEFAFDAYKIFFVTEKDAYENALFDYNAAGIMIDEGTRRFALGKYNLDLGSGIMLSPVGSFFHSVDFRMMTRERGIIPYTSVLENGGFFGAALTDTFLLNYTLFYSNQKLDGRIDSFGFAHTFDESGEHVDSASLNRKDRINEEILGFDVRYKLRNIIVSNRTYLCSYIPKFVCDDSSTEFYGDRFWISGIGLKYFEDYYVMFSEFARSYKNRIGGLFGFTGSFSSIDINLAGEYFPVGFYSPKGIEAREDHIGGVVTIDKQSKIIDFGTTLEMANSTEKDTAEYDLKLNFEKEIGIVVAKFQSGWRFTAQATDRSGSRIFLRITPVKRIFLDIRLEEKYVYGSSDLEKGLLGAFEIGAEFDRLRFRIRYGLFETDSYASRIYVYEIDLPGIVNNRMLYNKGDYGFIYMLFKPIEVFNIATKYSFVKRDTVLVKQLSCQLDFRL